MHQHKHLLTADDLHNLLEVDFEVGTLIWKKRPVEMFNSSRAASAWNAKNSGKRALDSLHIDGYKSGTLFAKPYLAHRVIFAMQTGIWPEFIDHINGNRLDNRICNLRSVTRSENGCNAKTPACNTSGHIGVSWNKRDKRWSAFITLHKKRKALGNFIEKKDAIVCRKNAESLYGFHENHGRIL